jgi:3-deoxy-D-manno-octulosonic-acid transferase
MLAIAPLLEAFKREGSIEVYLTTTTSTGYKLAKEKYGNLTIGTGYFPLDFWSFSARAWRRIKPDLCVLMEGERWPEHVHQAEVRRVPMISVNARLSDRSFRRSLKFRPLLKPLAQGITEVLCSSKRDEQRFKALGYPAGQLSTTGNLKLDVHIPLMNEVEKAQLRLELGLPDGLILLGSSTWPGEEMALIEALLAARGRGLGVSLLLVPRHAERREELRGLLEKSGLSFHFRSAGRAEREVDVAVGDTTGELRKFTQLADLVFVGKSLAPHEGGQTPVEAAVLGKPILHGPHMTNFREIIRTLTEAGAVREVASPIELRDAVVELLQDSATRGKLAAAARGWHEINRGATERTFAAIRRQLGN